MLTGLISIFEYIGGVPTALWFDNLSPIVTSIKKHGEIILNERFEKFSMHYGLEHNFCNPNSGHENGSVETKFGYNRINYFVPNISRTLKNIISNFLLWPIKAYIESTTKRMR